VYEPLDQAWQELLPGYESCVAFTRTGLPFHAVIEGSHDERPRPAQIPAALRAGKSIILLQPHEVMPRLMRLVVALRAAFFGAFFDESSYLFMTEGKGKPGMKPHHDGEAHSFWLQLAGKRTVTVGPQVPPGTRTEPEALDLLGPGWTTLELGPGSLFYLQPRVLHSVVCHERSLALSLTWELLPGDEVLGAWLEKAAPTRPELFRELPAARAASDLGKAIEECLHGLTDALASLGPIGPQLYAEFLTRWSTVPGTPLHSLPGASGPLPPARADPALLWAQRPALFLAGRQGRSRLVADQVSLSLRRRLDAGHAQELPFMPCWSARDWEEADPRLLRRLLSAGLLAGQDLPVLIQPEDIESLSGWQFGSYEVH
jgi:hypothetical protein